LETGWASPLHPLLLELLLARLLGVQVDMNSITPVHPEHVAESLATPMQRSKLVVTARASGDGVPPDSCRVTGIG
jgi:hypothetical protein